LDFCGSGDVLSPVPAPAWLAAGNYPENENFGMRPFHRTGMIDAILHTGLEHPDLAWILGPSLLAFLAGVGLGTYADRLRSWLRPDPDEAPE